MAFDFDLGYDPTFDFGDVDILDTVIDNSGGGTALDFSFDTFDWVLDGDYWNSVSGAVGTALSTDFWGSGMDLDSFWDEAVPGSVTSTSGMATNAATTSIADVDQLKTSVEEAKGSGFGNYLKELTPTPKEAGKLLAGGVAAAMKSKQEEDLLKKMQQYKLEQIRQQKTHEGAFYVPYQGKPYGGGAT